MYPEFDAVHEALSAGVPDQLRPLLESTAGLSESSRQYSAKYDFSTSNRNRKVSLTPSFIALTEHAYSRWESFREAFSVVEAAFSEVYQPDNYSRVGLRYINWIDREKLGLSSDPWSPTLNSDLTGFLGDADYASNVVETRNMVIFHDFPQEGAMTRIQHGLWKPPNADDYKYVIDTDTYIEKRVGIKDALAILDEFNLRQWHIFQWAIGSELRDTLGPTTLTE